MKYLIDKEKKCVEELVNFISAVSSAEVYLYGSKARGDFNEKSDIDILVISDKLTQEIKNLIVSRAKEINKLNEVFMVPFILFGSTLEHFNDPNNSLAMNIRKECILLN